MTVDVGLRLRSIRDMYGLSQRELAKRAGVTNGMISQIEQNRVSPSVGSLKKILDGLPISMADFFTLEYSTDEQVFYTEDELPDLANGDISFRLVGANVRERAMAILHELYLPGTDTGSEMLSHDGEEGGVVVRGQIEVTVGTQSRVLGPGDAYYFRSRLPHRFRNLGEEECEIVSANTPPTF
ncbi:MAG: cupin domain-containing protein [Pseudomonadota bacterium]